MNPAALLASLLLLPLFFFILAERRRRISRYSISKKLPLPPSPPGLPFIGNLHELGSLPHQSLSLLSNKHGPLMLLHLGPIPTVVVSSPAVAQHFMKNHDTVFASRPSLKASRALSYNNIDVAFSPYGDCWRQMRKISMCHLLSAKMVQSFASVRRDEVAALLRRVSDNEGTVLCVTEMLNELVSNVLCRVVVGSAMGDERRRLISTLVQQNSIFNTKVFVEDFFPRLRWLDWILGLDEKLKRHVKAWDALLEDFIQDHSISSNDSNNIIHPSADRTDFIDVLLQLQKDPNLDFVLTRDHIKSTLLDMFAAGTDTSFIVLDWSMAELIRNPKVMKKVQDEVRAVAGGEEMINEEHLPKMSYLKAVVKEVLRLHPPIPLLLPRESTEECQIQGYRIPKQTRVIVNAWSMGRDAAYWEDPGEFKPERFAGSALDFKGREFQFIPFGAGRRICPGMSFAIVVVELALANLLHRFDWKLPNGMVIEDMNMEDSPGLVALRRQKLELIPLLAQNIH
ncbi:Cytochrome P450 71A9 [Platanthera zijinensis]|uniref:Cytochrome P450 71A9 n=1 Tax=Platanthera zijinensis TaxID=2320716 RepID=A0AAP0G0C8_9ASPA